MKRIWLVLLAGALLTWNAFAQESRPPRERPERSAPPQAEKKGSGTEASANASASTSATAQAGQNSASISSGTTFEAALDKPLDAKKNKEGDKVFAHTTQAVKQDGRSEEHTSELQSPCNLVCRLLLEKKKKNNKNISTLQRKRRDQLRCC